MDIDEAQFWHLQNSLWQDQSISHHHHYIRIKFSDQLLALCRA